MKKQGAAKTMNSTSSFSDMPAGKRKRGFWHASVAYWICQCFGWSFYLLLCVYAWSMEITPLTAREILSALSVVGSGIFFTHLLRGVIQHQGWRSLPAGGLLLRALLAALLVSALIQGTGEIVDLIAARFGLAPESMVNLNRSRWAMTLMGIGAGAFMISIWQALYFLVQMVRLHRREEADRWKLEAALATAELDALKAQLNPHFLFNCLNGLRALVLEDPARSQNVITRLASVLRYSLQSNSAPQVSLERELQTVDDYLDLEAIRFEERLKVRREIDPASLVAQVPPMIVQTLVENAIKYGVSQHPEPGEIVIASSLTSDELVITVTNQGQLEPRPESTGLGLKNAADRLRHLFGQSATLSLRQSEPDLVTATIRLPCAQQARLP